jgi:hemin uptake protein HemP
MSPQLCHGEGHSDSPAAPPAVAAAGGRREPPPALSSQQLMQGHSTVAITHNGTTCRLQATRLGKLILTK